MPPFEHRAGQYDGRFGDAGGQPSSRRIAHGRPRSVADARSQWRTSTITHPLGHDEPDPENESEPQPQAVAKPDARSLRDSGFGIGNRQYNRYVPLLLRWINHDQGVPGRNLLLATFKPSDGQPGDEHVGHVQDADRNQAD